MTNTPSRPRVAVLLDLTWRPQSGGHVKTWERLARAAIDAPDDVDLTLHVSGARQRVHELSENVRFRVHEPVFSSARLPFLSHLPDHTDLAWHHAGLARALDSADVIHTTDAFFAFARTAERVARRRSVALIHSLQTDIPAYTRIYTAQTVERLFPGRRLRAFLLERMRVAERVARGMQTRLHRHLHGCTRVLVSRNEDAVTANAVVGHARVARLRRGLDQDLFSPRHCDRNWLRARLQIPDDRFVILTVGRLDRVKNVALVAEAVRQLGARGRPVHLCCAGEGSERDVIEARLGDRVSFVGFLPPDQLARHYASADLFAHAARAEVYSNVVREALASGVPAVVGSDSAHGLDAAVRVQVDDERVESWVAAIDRLIADPGVRRHMGHAGRAYVEREIPSWAEVLRGDVLPVWRKAAAGRARERDERAC
jgi:glycosyltransferase involved in cell wall biosynthesis